MGLKKLIIVSFIILAGLFFCQIGIYRISAQTEPPSPDMPPLPQGLDPPPTVYPPTQISEGSNTYYLVCMACHGDRGQGLSDEWRGALDPADQNCWQSRCHASNHPPDGFVFPKAVPALASPGMLARFDTALDLYQFIRTKMPFQAPGSLSDQEYWQLTAFLVSLNGIHLDNLPLTPEKAAQIPLRERVVRTSPEKPQPIPKAGWVGIGFGGITVFLLLLIGLNSRKRSGKG
jgi:Cytochrome C oxidase, cbb3-type, subunit III